MERPARLLSEAGRHFANDEKGMNMTRKRAGPMPGGPRPLLLLMAALLLSGGMPTASAAGDSNAALLRELHELRSAVHTLAARVDKLEQMQHPAAASAAAPAQQQPTELKTEVHELRAQVKQLQTQQAESAKAAQAAAAAAAQQIHSKESSVRENWHKIQAGMSEDQVAALLGQPAQKFMLGSQQVWYYVYPGSGNGSVMFSPGRRVVSSQSPPAFGWGLF